MLPQGKKTMAMEHTVTERQMNITRLLSQLYLLLSSSGFLSKVPSLQKVTKLKGWFILSDFPLKCSLWAEDPSWKCPHPCKCRNPCQLLDWEHCRNFNTVQHHHCTDTSRKPDELPVDFKTDGVIKAPDAGGTANGVQLKGYFKNFLFKLQNSHSFQAFFPKTYWCL